METIHMNYLEQACGAISRRDYLSAMQYALRAARVPRGLEHVRCEAYIVLALTSLELGAPEDALAFAVGAHLAACWSRDEEREAKAASVVNVVLAHHPQLGEGRPSQNVH